MAVATVDSGSSLLVVSCQNINLPPGTIAKVPGLSSHHVATERDHQGKAGQILAAERSVPEDLEFLKLLAPLRKSGRLALRLVSFLSGSQGRTSREEADTDGSRGCWETRARPSITVGDARIIIGSSSGSSDRSDNGVKVFREIHFAFPGKAQCFGHSVISSRQLLHLRCSDTRRQINFTNNHGASSFYSITIVSGLCLFVANVMPFQYSISNPDVSALDRATPTLYEMGTIAILASAIVDVTSFIILQRRSKLGAGYSEDAASPWEICVKLDIPRFQYYLPALAALREGRCSMTEAWQWLNAVDRRHDQVVKVFSKAIDYELGLRGVDPESPELKHSLSTGSDAAAGAIRKSL